MSLIILAIIFGVLALNAYFFNKSPVEGDSRKKKLKGPLALPLFGNVLHFIRAIPYEKYRKWSEKYGPIYRVKLGPKLNIVISDAKLLREIFNDPNYEGRPDIDLFQVYPVESERLGILATEGPLWEAHRRFSLRSLRDFGFNRKAMELNIIGQVDQLISNLKLREGEPIKDLKRKFLTSIINSLWSVLCSDYSDPKVVEVFDDLSAGLNLLIKRGLLAVFCPSLRTIAPGLIGYKEFRKAFDQMGIFFEIVLEQRKRTFDEDNIRDFVDAYLSEIKRTTDPTSSFYGKFGEKQLVSILAEIFFAGSDTTSLTLTWAVLYLCKNPQIQQKFQGELDKVESKSISLEDRPRMPYTLALIDEVFRLSSITPMAFQHRALEDKIFHDYFIPKDAWIMPDLHFIHNNTKTWGDPENFRPERFIDSSGNFRKDENVIPFDIGRRACIGEGVARDTVFLYLTNIFRNFEFKFNPDEKEPVIKPKPSMILEPYPYTVIIKDRLNC